MTIDLPNPAAAGVRYAYKASLVGSAHQFELTDHGLSWQVGGTSGLWPYDEISAIRLSYRPVSMQSRRFRADIDRAGGGRIRIYVAAIILLVLVGIAIAGLLLRAVATGEWAGALFLVGFAALFGWQIGGFVTRNRPRTYTFDDLPKPLLP
jgi:hypothetical protein